MRTHPAQGRHTRSMCYLRDSFHFYRTPSESFPVTSSALLKAIWQTDSRRAENGIFLGELKIIPALLPSPLTFSCAGKEAWRGVCSSSQNMAGCYCSRTGEKSEAQRTAQARASMGAMAQISADPGPAAGSFTHPAASKLLLRAPPLEHCSARAALPKPRCVLRALTATADQLGNTSESAQTTTSSPEATATGVKALGSN